MKMIINLKNLTCANCASKIEKRTQTLKYVESCEIDFANQKMYVEFSKIDKNLLFKEIKKIVVTLEPKVIVSIEDKTKKKEKMDEEKEELDKEKEKKKIRNKFIELFISAIFLILASTLKINENINLCLYLAAYIIAGHEVIISSLRNIKKRDIFDENFLMMIATVGAFFIGEYLEGVLVMLLYELGENASDIAVADSRASIKNVLDLKLTSANVYDEENDKIIQVDVEKVNEGDIVVVKVGEKVPTDAVIIKGNSHFDTSSLTGESAKKKLKVGDNIYSGYINVDSVIYAKVLKRYENSEISKMIEMIENATAKKTNTEKFITRFARVYTPIVVALAVIIALIPLALKGSLTHEYIYKALSFLVVSCPCALVLSVPLGYFAGIGNLSKKGILMKGTNIFEKLDKINHIAFDKTGTITKGDFALQDIVVKNSEDNTITKDYLVTLAKIVEEKSNHPVALAICKWKMANEDEKIKIFKENMDDISVLELPSKGMKLNAIDKKDGKNVEFIIGNKTIFDDKIFKEEELKEILKTEENICGTILYMIINDKYVGYINISDTIKPEAKDAIKSLKKLNNMTTLMLTGDNKKAARLVADTVDIDKFASELMPQDKMQIIENIKKDKKNKVVFVGDGINDALVMLKSDSSIAMGSLGSDLSIESADVIIMDDDLTKISKLFKVAKKVKKVVKENIIFALTVKVLVMILITLGLTNMLVAVFSDVGVTLIAVINSVRILAYDNK